ncbi:leucine-rich repeat domain-containing protein [Patescibacteria group bacterium]|nr:leucine-rich repeat domain-containing protein [Patescibacteria group bacterium]
MGAVPDELGKLVSLTSKFFFQKFLPSLPIDFPLFLSALFFFLHFLELDLFGNKLKVIPGALGSCVKLEILDLRNNLLTIESMPRQFASLVNLKKIYLANNKLESIPEECFLLKGLEELDCSNNELHSLPDAIGTLVNLKKLQVSFLS